MPLIILTPDSDQMASVVSPASDDQQQPPVSGSPAAATSTDAAPVIVNAPAPRRFSDLLAEATASMPAQVSPHLTHSLIRAKRAAANLDQISFSTDPSELFLRFNNRCTEYVEELEEVNEHAAHFDALHKTAHLVRLLLEQMKDAEKKVLSHHKQFVDDLEKRNLTISQLEAPVSEPTAIRSLEAQARVINSFSTAFFHRILALDPTHVLPEGQSIVHFYNSRLREGSPPIPSTAEHVVRARLAVEAEKKEKAAVEAAYSNIKDLTIEWAGQKSVPDALVDALMQPHAVSIFSPFPSVALPNANMLPPIFAVPTPLVHRMQNKVQEIVALACIRAIAPKQPDADHQDWLSRLSVLLRSEVDAGCPTKPARRNDPSNTGQFEDLSPLKLQHLADEVLHTFSATLKDETEKARVRTSLDRVLQYKDPVYKLFKGRLDAFIREALHTPKKPAQVPGAPMRTGLMLVSPSTTSRAGTPTTTDGGHHQRVMRMPKGFEGQVFEELMHELVADLCGCIDWAHNLWAPVVGEDLFAHHP